MTEFVCAYRFQLTPSDDFIRAAEQIPYLRALGVSHLYLSPIAEAEPGSEHGYDIVAPDRIRGELGGAVGFDRLCQAAKSSGIGIILDIVPNHLSIATPELNPWFWHVLRHGRASPYASAFDIDWNANGGRLLLPVLDGTLDDAVDASTIEDGDDGSTIVLAGGLRLPLRGLDPSAPIPERAELTELLSQQVYRLVHWRTRDRNHRRFFEIDTLAGVSIEDPLVRRQRHALLVRLLDRYPELLAGVRVDHVDGLADPDEYLTWLRGLIGPERLLLVEKIVIDDESLPGRWPVDGTTGYEFSRLVDQLLLDPDGTPVLHEVWKTATGSSESYESVEHRSIDEVLRDRLRPEVDRIHRLVDDVEPLQGPVGVETIIALATAMDRYRTYLPHGGRDDIELLAAAGSRAGERSGGRYPVARLVALLTNPDSERHEQAQTLFQQLTGPALAKGAEDRALYRHHPIAALNEVGGDPDADPAPASAFHAWAERSAQRSPRQLLTTSTHDTKRSGDLRARVLALTHHASAWRSFHERWSPSSTVHPADLHLLLQTVIGAWPIDTERLSDYLVKALREGAERSSWIDPDQAYEAAVCEAGIRLLGDAGFIEDLEQLVAVIEPRAVTNSLIQTTLRLTAPGFGDLYRGSEVFDRSLVDPDNRRPVAWERLAVALDTATQLDVSSALDRSPDMAKMALIVRLLEARRTHTDACRYERLEVHAADPERVIAFRRDRLVVVAAIGPTEPGAFVPLPAGHWRSTLYADRSSVSELRLGDLAPNLPFDCLQPSD